jgi:hypothetical protein
MVAAGARACWQPGQTPAFNGQAMVPGGALVLRAGGRVAEMALGAAQRPGGWLMAAAR